MATRALTLRERQQLLREEAILDAAHERIADASYDTVTMDEIAAQVGISKATLYQHFASKEELMARVIGRAIRRTERYLDELPEALSPIERLEATVAYVIEQRFAGAQSSGGSGTRSILHPHLRHHSGLMQEHDALVERLERLVREAKEAGEIEARFPSALVVRVLLSCARDADYERLLTNGTITLDELKSTLIAMLFSGLRPDAAPPPS